MLRHVVLLVTLATGLALANTPLLNALELVPAEEFVLDETGLATFADVTAGLAAHDLQVPADWAELQASSDPNRILFALPWVLPADLMTYLAVAGPEYPAVIGLDFFQIEQTLGFGQPPEQVIALLGDFDPTAVTEAFTARDYQVARDDDTGRLLCPVAGCDTGTAVDMANRNPANPFGGGLGRSFPVLLRDSVLVGSPSDVALNIVGQSAAGDTVTLADLPETQAVSNALYRYPFVSSVAVISPLTLAMLTPAELVSGDVDAAEALLAQLAATPVPAYSLAAMADVADAEYNYGITLLAYADQAAADLAAESLEARLTTLTSSAYGDTFAEIFEEAGELLPVRVTTDEATGISVVHVVLQAPRETVSEPGRSGLQFRRMFQSVMANDYLWLLPGQ